MGLVVFILILLVFGFLLGALARLAVPGPDPMGLLGTAAIGIAGSMLGGLISRIFFGTAGGFLFAFLGAFLLVLAWRKLVQRRPLTGPEARRLPR